MENRLQKNPQKGGGAYILELAESIHDFFANSECDTPSANYPPTLPIPIVLHLFDQFTNYPTHY